MTIMQQGVVAPGVERTTAAEERPDASLSDADADANADADADSDVSAVVDRIRTMLHQEESASYQCGVDYLAYAATAATAAGATPADPNNTDDAESRRRSASKKRKTSRRPIIDAECRTKMCQWCATVVEHCGYARETVSVAMSYLDRFMCSSSSSVTVTSCTIAANDANANANANAAALDDDRFTHRQYQLTAMVCLYVAVKLRESRGVLAADLIAQLSRGVYTSREVEEMELKVLEGLGWKMAELTPLGFLGHFVELLPASTSKGARSSVSRTEHDVTNKTLLLLLESGKRQTELAAFDYDLCATMMKPSSVAVAALLNSLDAVDGDGDNDVMITPADKSALLRRIGEACRGGGGGGAAADSLNEEDDEDDVRYARGRLRAALLIDKDGRMTMATVTTTAAAANNGNDETGQRRGGGEQDAAGDDDERATSSTSSSSCGTCTSTAIKAPATSVCSGTWSPVCVATGGG